MWKEEEGNTAIEYVVIMIFITLAMLSALALTGGTVQGTFCSVAHEFNAADTMCSTAGNTSSGSSSGSGSGTDSSSGSGTTNYSLANATALNQGQVSQIYSYMLELQSNFDEYNKYGADYEPDNSGKSTITLSNVYNGDGEPITTFEQLQSILNSMESNSSAEENKLESEYGSAIAAAVVANNEYQPTDADGDPYWTNQTLTSEDEASISSQEDAFNKAEQEYNNYLATQDTTLYIPNSDEQSYGGSLSGQTGHDYTISSSLNYYDPTGSADNEGNPVGLTVQQNQTATFSEETASQAQQVLKSEDNIGTVNDQGSVYNPSNYSYTQTNTPDGGTSYTNTNSYVNNSDAFGTPTDANSSTSSN